MDPNLLYWKEHGQSFLSRLQVWFRLVDPGILFASDGELRKARALLRGGEKLLDKDQYAPALSLASIHPDSGLALPPILRPPALLPITAPLMIASFLPLSSMLKALFFQSLLQSYAAGFNHFNRNSSAEKYQGRKTSTRQFTLISTAVVYTTFAGAMPQMLTSRYVFSPPALQAFFRHILPVPASAALAALSVHTIRGHETDVGVKVFDSEGNPVGVSKAAGEKAVSETALSRAVLFGTTATGASLLSLLFKRKESLLFNSIRHLSTVLVMGLMIPVSFSLFPQLGAIKQEHLEEELQGAAKDGQLYYNRGL